MEFTESEKEALGKLRSALGNTKLPYDHDCYLIRWLKARNMNVTKAEDMLRKHLKWREENKVDEIVATYEPCEVLKKYHPLTRLGNDKEGNPLFLYRIGTFDIKGILLSVGPQNLFHFDVALAEKNLKECHERTVKTGKLARIYLLHDMDQISVASWFNKTVFDWMNFAGAVQDNNYPESMHKIVAINCSKTFHTLYNAVKRFMPDDTKQKFVAFGKDNWKEFLLREIDANLLPEYYGGTLSDSSGDPTCPKLIKMGGKVPEELYLTHRLSEIVSKEEVKRCIVKRRSIEDVPAVAVTKPGSVLKFIVCIESMDISFQVVYCKDDNSKDGEAIVRDSEKLSSANVFARFDLPCSNPGKYILRFDNSYSYWNAKEVFYKIEVIE